MHGAFLIVLVTVSGVVYHLAQKIAGKASPWPTLAVAYGAAFIATVLLAIADRAPLPPRAATIAGLLIGVSALGIEAGFFFLYRAGWPLASASVIASVAGTAILALVGVVVMGEPLTVGRATGITLAAGAGILIARG